MVGHGSHPPEASGWGGAPVKGWPPTVPSLAASPLPGYSLLDPRGRYGSPPSWEIRCLQAGGGQGNQVQLSDISIYFIWASTKDPLCVCIFLVRSHICFPQTTKPDVSPPEYGEYLPGAVVTHSTTLEPPPAIGKYTIACGKEFPHT